MGESKKHKQKKFLGIKTRIACLEKKGKKKKDTYSRIALVWLVSTDHGYGETSRVAFATNLQLFILSISFRLFLQY